ncbi:MAG: BLUF domain-containing protein [Fimbriimonas sp.]
MGEILTELLYVSSASEQLADDELLAILEASRHNNERDGITGMLVYSEGSFLQVLEGPEPVIDSAYARISLDPRHRGLLRLRRRTVERRSFGDWSMGFARASRPDLLDMPGCNDFFADGKCLADVDDGQAKRLLEGFRARAR